jgi:hypothetical protein
MEDKPDFDAEFAALRRGRADLLEQIGVSRETIERSKELIRQIDDLLARSVLKP